MEQLAMFPGCYAGGVSLFGAFDLPMLLEKELHKVSALEADEAEGERKSLMRQFCNPDNEEEMLALASISPVKQLNRITEPVVLIHNRDDAVISFAQSEFLFSAMTNMGLRVEFHIGDGGHGFSTEEEAAIYEMLVERLRLWCGNVVNARP